MWQGKPYPLCRWPGSKAFLATRIVRYLRPEPVLDLFGGAGNIVTRHPYGGVWNDIDKRLYEMADALRVNPIAYQCRCESMPKTGKEVAETWNDIRQRLDDCLPHELAWALYHTWGGRLTGRAHNAIIVQNTWRDYIDGIANRARRWKEIQDIQCLDWQGALERYPDMQVFADPPYINTGQCYLYSAIDYDALHATLAARNTPVYMTSWAGTVDWPYVTIDGGHRNNKNIGYSDGPGKLTHLFSPNTDAFPPELFDYPQ